MVDPQLRVGVDVGSKTHQVGIASPDGVILEEFTITHSQGGFREFFDRIEHHLRKLDLSVAVAMEGYNGHACPLLAAGVRPSFLVSVRLANAFRGHADG